MITGARKPVERATTARVRMKRRKCRTVAREGAAIPDDLLTSLTARSLRGALELGEAPDVPESNVLANACEIVDLASEELDAEAC
jgi:hypothetical protein